MFSIADIREFRAESREKSNEHARANAEQARTLVQADRELVMRDKIQRMETLLLRCLPHVQDAFQGRGDRELIADMQEEFRRG